MSPSSNWQTAATVTTQFVKAGKAQQRCFLPIQSFLCVYFHCYLFLFVCLFCSSPPKSNLLRKYSTEREIPLTSYLLRPTRMSFFVGREMVGVRSQTFHLHRKHGAFCPCWMSLVRRSSSGMMGECERLEIRCCWSPNAVRMTESKKVEWNERNEVICLPCSDTAFMAR